MRVRMFECSVNQPERKFAGEFSLDEIIEANEDGCSPEELVAFTDELLDVGSARILGCVGSYAEFERID